MSQTGLTTVSDPKLRRILESSNPTEDDLSYLREATHNAYLEDLANPEVPITLTDKRIQVLTRFVPPTFEQLKEFWRT